MFSKIYSHMSFTKAGRNCLFLSKRYSANDEEKSIVKNDFKKPEHFSINDNEGVILE